MGDIGRERDAAAMHRQTRTKCLGATAARPVESAKHPLVDDAGERLTDRLGIFVLQDADDTDGFAAHR
jgi:hypothetical protein